MSLDPWLRRLLWLVLAGLCLLAWQHSFDAPFVYDDKVEVIGNRTIRMLDEWRAIVAYNISRPLLIATYAVNLDLGQLDPTGFHVANLLIHVLAAGAALALAEAVGALAGRPRALMVGGAAVALWAVHPMTTEAVTYITGRSESLCALFCFAGLAAWARALLAERGDRSGIGWRVLGLLAFCGAVTSKEVGAMLPLAYLWLEWLFARGRRVRWAWLLPLALAVGLAAWLRLQHAGTLLPREVDRPLATQLVTASTVWLRYLGLWLLPVGQTIFHHQEDVRPGSVQGIGSVLLLAGLFAGGAWAGRGRPGVAFGLGAAALFLVPGASFVALKEHMAEHRAYQQGLYLALALALAIPPARDRRAGPLVLLLLVPLVFATRARNEIWRSEVSLWAEAANRRPDVADAWYGLGDARRFAGDLGGAASAYKKAVELDPAHLDAWTNLGIALAEQGEDQGAKRAWREALKRRPSWCKAHNNLGSLAFRRQRWEEARSELSSTLAWCPSDPIAHYLLGRIYDEHLPDKDQAVRHYEALLRIDPSFSQAEFVRDRLLSITF